MHANPFPSSEWHASCPLELVHTDVHMLPYRTFSGNRYWVTFIDDYSRYHFVTPMAAKSDVFEAFKCFKAFAENQSERKLKTLRNDKSGEYMSNAMAEFTAHCGIEVSTLSGLVLNRMGWQRMLMDSCLSASLPCWTSKALPRPSGVRL